MGGACKNGAGPNMVRLRLEEDWRQDEMDRYGKGFKRKGVVF